MAWTCGTEGKTKIHMEYNLFNIMIWTEQLCWEVLKPLSAGGWEAAAVQGQSVLVSFLTLLCKDLPSLGLGYSIFSLAPVALLMLIKICQREIENQSNEDSLITTGVSQSHESVFQNWSPSLWLFFYDDLFAWTSTTWQCNCVPMRSEWE